MRFKAKFNYNNDIFDKIRMNLDYDKFLDNMVLHADADIDWAIGEKLNTYERVASFLMSRDAYKIKLDIFPFGKFMNMNEHAQNVYSKRMNKALDKILQIAEKSFK